MALSLEERVSQLEREVLSLKALIEKCTNPNQFPASLAGIGADDPLFEEWIRAIVERRRELDAD
jgi:hypothetical protein